jgi:DNA-binding CsgD family transcriptional regulator
VIVQEKISATAELVAIMEEFGDRGCAIGLCFTNGYPAWHHFSYAPEFLRRYEAEDLAKTDLTLTKGFSEDGVFLWSEVEKQLGSSETMRVARSFGMAEGICFSETINGVKSIASISLTGTDRVKRVPVDRILNAFKLAAISVSKELSQPDVSPKISAYLSLVARGLSDQEIADELQLSVHGARRRRKLAIEKYGAKTISQAVALAISSGAVQPYQNV